MKKKTIKVSYENKVRNRKTEKNLKKIKKRLIVKKNKIKIKK